MFSFSTIKLLLLFCGNESQISILICLPPLEFNEILHSSDDDDKKIFSMFFLLFLIIKILRIFFSPLPNNVYFYEQIDFVFSEGVFDKSSISSWFLIYFWFAFRFWPTDCEKSGGEEVGAEKLVLMDRNDNEICSLQSCWRSHGSKCLSHYLCPPLVIELFFGEQLSGFMCRRTHTHTNALTSIAIMTRHYASQSQSILMIICWKSRI